jgi:arylsulfatase A-like enzyme
MTVSRVALICAAIMVGVASMAQSPMAAAAEKPNIILIVGDDMGYADIGVHGCKDIPTPNIDALAHAGVRCTNGYVSGPYCSPTRAGLLTGRYQTRFGHEFNPGGGAKRRQRAEQAARPRRPRPGLPLSEMTIADRLKAAGYSTGIVGKWHLGSAPRFHPQRRGFDELFGFLGGAHAYFPGDNASILRGSEPVDETEYLTDALGREAAAFIDRQADKPFFLYLAFNAVHTPMHADDVRLAKFERIRNETRRTYAAMMSAMDDAVGAVLAKLEEKNLDKNTLVFFISDNGGPTMLGTTRNGSINTPLRGSKRTTLEGGIRVPFLVKWSSQLPAGKVYAQPIIQLDFLPTALAAAGIDAGAGDQIDGVNLLPYIRVENDEPPHDALYWRFGQQMAIRQGDWKLVKYDPHADSQPGKSTDARLYNLANDIGERDNLIEQEPERARALQAAWDEWNSSNVAPLWGDGSKARKSNAKKQPRQTAA